MSIIHFRIFSATIHQLEVKSAIIAVAGEFELTFTNTDIHKMICIWKTNQDNPHL